MTKRVSQSLVHYLMNHDDLVLDLAWRVSSLEDQLQAVLKYLEPKYIVQYQEDAPSHLVNIANEKDNPTWHLVNDEWLLASQIMKTLNKDYIRHEAKKHMRKFSLSIIDTEKEEANADGV